MLLSSACILFSGCMSQQSATKETTHEFIEELPNHPKTEVFDKVVKWIGASFKSSKAVSEYQDREVGSIVSYVNTEIKPAGTWVSMPIGFTMNVDVRNDKISVRFSELRRLYGSKKYQEPLIACLAQICQVEEQQCIASDSELRESLVVAEAMVPVS